MALLIDNRTVVGYYSQITGQCWGVTLKEQDSCVVLLTNCRTVVGYYSQRT